MADTTLPKKNIFIILGASEYLEDENKLPACKNDVEKMQGVLEISGKYDDQLVLLNKSSDETNSKLSEFIKENQNSEIGELFFYFTGHGSREDDFRFLFMDYKESDHNSTSLSNEDLDQMLRSVNADLVVKVVDACHSSSSYVKSDSKLKDILDTSSKTFNSAYFMFSSRSDEVSVANHDISYFTRSFLESLDKPLGTTILYRQVAASIADDTFLKSKQNPQFVHQGDNTEKFLVITEGLTKSIKAIKTKTELTTISPSKTENTAATESIALQLKDVISELEKSHASEVEAKEAIEIYLKVFEDYKFDDVITSNYEVETKELEDYNQLTGLNKVAKWLDTAEKPYFATVINKTETYRKKEYTNAFQRLTNPFAANSDYSWVDAQRSVPSSIRLSVNQDVKGRIKTLTPTGQVLSCFKILTLYVFSKTELVVFVKYERLIDITWSERRMPNNNDWQFEIIPIKLLPQVKSRTEEILKSQEERILTDISKKVGFFPDEK